MPKVKFNKPIDSLNRRVGDLMYYVALDEEGGVPSGQSVSEVAVASDNPGNSAECQRWHFIPARAA